ncbi:hypothetical protein KCMC57_up58160 [Kitasatospora sp. CMC57]|uniref:Tyr recombinase domain-containing protein n=1 Tax=Kitasatospora sp. CMC57 TaxID=3231513 RepID=A0AB33KDE9_9ACTN
MYDLRHTAAGIMIAENLPAAVISKTMRHSTLAVTVNLYGHLLKDSADEAVDTLASGVTCRKASAARTSAGPRTWCYCTVRRERVGREEAGDPEEGENAVEAGLDADELEFGVLDAGGPAGREDRPQAGGVAEGEGGDVQVQLTGTGSECLGDGTGDKGAGREVEFAVQGDHGGVLIEQGLRTQ